MNAAPARLVSRRRMLQTLGWSAGALLGGGGGRSFGNDVTRARWQAAAEYSATCTGVAMLVMQGGRVIFEDYRDGHSAGARRKIYSGTKGFWVLAGLKAAEEGILDLDERVAATIAEWRASEARARITVRQLLNFSSGLDAANQLHGDNLPDRNAVALHTPVVAAPGGAFIYGPAALQVFDEVLKRKLAARGDTPVKYLERRVLRPMGLGPQRYLEDQRGNPLLATGFMMTTRQWARLGQLILDGGCPVVAASSLALCFRGSAANGAFGMGFWNNAMAAARTRREIDIEDNLELKWYRQNWSGVCLCADAPEDLVGAIGSGYQRLFVIPSEQLVVVRQGKFGRMSDGKFLRILLGKA